MIIKHTALFLLVFTCTPTGCAHDDSNSKYIIPATIITIGIVHLGTLGLLNVPLSNAKKIGFKKNLSPAHILTSAAIGASLSLVYTIASATSYDDQNKHTFNPKNACNNHISALGVTTLLTTAYNIYQCTKEEPQEPAEIGLPTHINAQALEQLQNNN